MMDDELSGQLTAALGRWTGASVVTDRRGVQVQRVRLLTGVLIAVKAALDGESDSAVLPLREATVIRKVGDGAGVLAAGTFAGGGSWNATPWWHGPTLHEVFKDVRQDRDDPRARSQAAQAAANAADALCDLHTAGWAHGDMQPDHVVHTHDGARILDLAAAHHPRCRLPDHLNVPYQGALVHLEAPEIARSLLEGLPTVPSLAADVYALGGALWASWSTMWPVDYAAAGVDPAPGDLPAKRAVVADGRWQRPLDTGVWPRFETLLQDALAFRPDSRPSARVLARELRRIAEEETP